MSPHPPGLLATLIAAATGLPPAMVVGEDGEEGDHATDTAKTPYSTGHPDVGENSAPANVVVEFV
jgi:hypothetical protein